MKTPSDLTKTKTPSFILSTKEDHIAPWKSTYAATQLYGGPVRFVLAASGHIAGVVNPPAAGKYHHWTNPRTLKARESCLASEKAETGSWWPIWTSWVAKFADGKVPARKP